jgi:hypothetical protein
VAGIQENATEPLIDQALRRLEVHPLESLRR